MRWILAPLALGAVALAAPALAAQQPRTIAAGMTTDEVRAAFGAPTVVRQADGWTYFFYTNRCLPRCGTDDTVFFHDGRVVAAVLHSPGRRFAGPAAATALGAAADAAPRAGGAAVSGIRVRLPADEPPVDLGVIRGRPGPAAPAAEAAAAADTSRAVRADTLPVPPGPDQERQLRERRVEPSTVRPAPEPAPPPAEPRSREERIEPNTIRRPRP